MGIKVKFWGVRGSIACPGSETVVYGGNTACVELFFKGANRRIIVDAGSGIRLLGDALLASQNSGQALQTDIFLTHTHWDHIMGFPFFGPLYVPGTRLNVYGPITFEEDPLEKIVGDLLRYRYFPLRHSEISADVSYHQLGECSKDLGNGIGLRTKFLNHPLLCLGYRFEYKGKSVCTAYDTEPFRNVFRENKQGPASDPVSVKEGQKAAVDANIQLIDFYRNADLLIHDAQYTFDEYESAKIGWGHSAFEHAVQAGIDANVKTVVFFHHDPQRTDTELKALERIHNHEGSLKYGIQTIVAREGLEINI